MGGDQEHDERHVLALAEHHPHLVSTALAMGGCVLFAGAATVVDLLHLPAVALGVPWAIALSLVASALFVAREARQRLGTGGVDAETEQRIIEAAVLYGGRLTTTAVAHALSIALVDADRALTALSRAGYLGIETHPTSGVLVYVFPEIDAGLVLPMRLPRHVAPSLPAGPSRLPSHGAPPLPGSAFTLVRVSGKRKTTAALLALCGGALGFHKFYLGQTLAGLVYLALFWTFLPAIAGLFEGLALLTMSDHSFDLKHNARLA
jgi:TM2 domain-containing membrane protein YozV